MFQFMEKLIHSSTDCTYRKQNYRYNFLFRKIPVSLNLGTEPITEFQRHFTLYAYSYVYRSSSNCPSMSSYLKIVQTQWQGGEMQATLTTCTYKLCLCHVGIPLHQGVSQKWQSMTRIFVLYYGPEHQQYCLALVTLPSSKTHRRLKRMEVLRSLPSASIQLAKT